jgi:hypothetical protein
MTPEEIIELCAQICEDRARSFPADLACARNEALKCAAAIRHFAPKRMENN